MTLTLAFAILAQSTGGAGNVTIAPVTATVTAKSCRVAAGNLDGSGSVLPVAVDGRRLKAIWQIAALRRNTPPGQLIVIEGGDFSRQKIGAIDLSAVCFRGTKLVNTVWTETKGLGIGFINADLTNARFDRVEFDNILFRNSTLSNLMAAGSRFVFGQLDGGWSNSIAGLNLDGAQLIGFRFLCGVTAADGCAFDRKQLSMRGTNLSGASLSTFAFWDTSFDGAILNQTEIGIDQVTRFTAENIKGPITLRYGRNAVVVPATAFATLRKALSTADAGICSTPATAITKLACDSPSPELLRLYRDIELLEQRGAAASLLSEEPKSYAAALDGCTAKDAAAAYDCAREAMNTWRNKLMLAIQKLQPLENGSRALYLSNDTNHLTVATETPVITPLLASVASSMVLAKKDSKGRIVDVRAAADDVAGHRCVVSDSLLKGKSAIGLSLRIWSGGAEFSKQPTAISSLQTGACNATVTSGPLVRVPISDADFDRLWMSTSAG
jgi:uncharacterized protein YjbI with pentapeptide repeats